MLVGDFHQLNGATCWTEFAQCEAAFSLLTDSPSPCHHLFGKVEKEIQRVLCVFLGS